MAVEKERKASWNNIMSPHALWGELRKREVKSWPDVLHRCALGGLYVHLKPRPLGAIRWRPKGHLDQPPELETLSSSSFLLL